MNRMRMSVTNVAAVVCWLVAAQALAQQLPAQPPAAPGARVSPAPPAPPVPPGFRSLKPSEFDWTGLDKIWKNAVDAMAWVPNDSWGWPFSQNASQSARGGAAQTESMEMAFSNPGSIGTVELHLFSGSVTVKGTNRKDVSLRVTHRGGDNAFERNTPPPPAGMKRLSPGRRGNLSVEEENNRIEVRSRPMNNSEMDLEIEVPARANLELRVINGGDISVENVEGAIEVNNINGPVRLTNVAGSVVASSTNANVTVRLTRVTDAKAMAFTSLSGTVDVTLPATTKANLKLRSDNGDVFTDFDVQQTEAPARSGWTRGRGGRGVRWEGSNTIYGTINGGGPEIEARSFNGSVFIRKAQ